MASVLHLIIIPPFLAVVCYMFGSILNITREKCIRERIITGFIGVLAVFQVIALPFMYYETNFTPLYIICICFLVLITVVFIYFVVSKRVFIPQKSSIVFWIKRKSKSEVALWALILFLIGSIGSGCAPSLGFLYGSRIIQSLGATFILPLGTIIGIATTWLCPSISRGKRWQA